ncbi:MAG: hypothetical protein NDJ90_15125, partial [Oligoflexia bacterium]|nr:hypothetical protein [Oligoflexia bacterium]
SELVGKDQLQSNLDDFLPELPAGDARAADRKALRESLGGSLSSSFMTCLSKARPDVAEDRNRCTDDFQKQATLSLGAAVGKAKAAEYLGPAARPEVTAIESALKTCGAKVPGGKKLKPALDACMKKFSVDLANSIGVLKLRASLADVLGTKGYAEASARVEKALALYRKCLDGLSALEFGERFTQGIDGCSKELYSRARGIVFLAIDKGMGHPVPGAEPRQNALAALARAIPCMDSLAGNQPEKDVERAGVDAPGLIDALVRYLKDYVDYDPVKANQDVEVVLAQLRADLAVLPPGEARTRLIDLMIKRGALDQFIRGCVQGKINELHWMKKLAAKGLYGKESLEWRKVSEIPEGRAAEAYIRERMVLPLLYGKELSAAEKQRIEAEAEKKVTKAVEAHGALRWQRSGQGVEPVPTP